MAWLRTKCSSVGCKVLAGSMLVRHAPFFATMAVAALSATHRAGAQIVPYFPTPQAVVDRILALAEVKESDFLIDLGCGDGRIPVTAAQRYGTPGLGVDIQPQVLAEAAQNASKAGVADKVTFRQEDLFQTDISKASVLALYLSLRINIELRPRILEKLKPGARVVSHNFVMGDWLPDRTEQIEGHMLYLWIVPAAVKGSWQLSYDDPGGAHGFALELDQQFQMLDGNAMIDGKAVPLRDARVRGERVSFAVDTGNDQPLRFEGRLVNGHLEGDGWKAARR
jgi:precorrin-6B methylase 2